MPKQPLKVLFANRAHPALKERLEALGFQCEEDLQSPMELIAAKIHGYTGLVLRSRISVPAALIERAEQLRFIAREGIGLEHIDVEFAEEKGIIVFNSPEGSADTVGEHAIGLLLGLLNHIPRADQQVHAGLWERESNRGIEILGKTIGIIGYGNTGKAFARKISGFGAKVLAFDKFLIDYGDNFAEAVSLQRIWEEADIVTIHIPYSGENQYFINKAFLEAFEKPIFLINTARGLVLHTADLVDALESGQVLGAALDVLEYEKSSFEQIQIDELPAPFQYLIQSDRVVLSPHIAGWSEESKARHGIILADKIEQWWKAQEH
ncbi:MAG: hydroxyacid dehydrogenase [Phaeodactylibacter sp.]|nr:hydroxyacid dehydrogenase [Phaeodactylibacter sp.]